MLARSARALLLLTLSSAAFAQLREAQKLTAANGMDGDHFGNAVALVDSTALIGADRHGSSGSAYVFVRPLPGTSFALEQELAPDAPLTGNARFGASVALSGDTAIVGAPLEGGLNVTGKAFAFARSQGAWTQQSELVASDGADNDNFGTSVSIDGDTAVVGAYRDDSNRGAAYVFVRTGNSWSEQQKLVADDGAAEDWFGWSVSVSGDTAVVGAPRNASTGMDSGAAYVFVREGSVWSQAAKIGGAITLAGDRFGSSVSLDGDHLAISSPLSDDVGTDAGSIFVFVRDGATWVPSAQVFASAPSNFDQFGHVVIQEDSMIVGVASLDEPGLINSGAAYVFSRIGASWIEVSRLTPSDIEAGDLFGRDVAISGDLVLVSAWFEDELGVDAGAAYAFDLPGATCFGVSCPCANDDVTGGCRNSTGRGGRLSASSAYASVSMDATTLEASELPSGNLALFVVADSLLRTPVQVGDGRLCIGGSTHRYRPAIVASDGSLTLSNLVGSAPPLTFLPGERRYLQVWSRDVFCAPAPVPCPSPCGNGSNVTNAIEIAYGP